MPAEDKSASMSPVSDQLDLLSIRPGEASLGTAFEGKIGLYRELGAQHVTVKVASLVTDTFSGPHPKSLKLGGSLNSWRLRGFLGLSSSQDGGAPEASFQRRVISTIDPTVYPQAHRVLVAARKQKVPVVLDLSLTHSPATWRFRLRERILVSLLKRRDSAIAGIAATAPKCLERYKRLGLGPLVDRVEKAFPGHPVDTSVFTPPAGGKPSSPRILVVARLVEEKGIRFICSALFPLLKEHPEWRIHFVGKGPLLDFIRETANHHVVAGQLEHTAHVSHDELPRVMQAASIYVSHALTTPAWEEYFGLANIEAMACGLASVLTPCGAVPWVAREDRIVRWVPEKRADLLQAAARELMTNPLDCERMGESARQFVSKHYSVSAVAEGYRRFLDRAIATFEK